MGSYYSIEKKEETNIPVAPPIDNIYDNIQRNELPLWVRLEFINNNKKFERIHKS